MRLVVWQAETWAGAQTKVHVACAMRSVSVPRGRWASGAASAARRARSGQSRHAAQRASARRRRAPPDDGAQRRCRRRWRRTAQGRRSRSLLMCTSAAGHMRPRRCRCTRRALTGRTRQVYSAPMRSYRDGSVSATSALIRVHLNSWLSPSTFPFIEYRTAWSSQLANPYIRICYFEKCPRASVPRIDPALREEQDR